MSSLVNKKRKMRKKKASLTLTSLPNDLLLSCLASVSRLYYPALSLVSKRFQSLLVSPDLYKIRSLLGKTESCLYVCVEFDSDPKPSWFTLYRKPDQTLNNDESSGFVLAKLPIMDSPPVNVSGLLAVGSSIYNVCRSSNVSVLDCTSHMWREGPRFPEEPFIVSASVLDEKIYVAGCYDGKDDSLKNTFQVLDTKTLIWNPMPPIPCVKDDVFVTSACIDGSFYVKNGTRVVNAYKTKEGRWDVVEPEMGLCMCSKDTCCVIENVLYSSFGRDITWYDAEVRKWRKLEGLAELPLLPYEHRESRVRLANYGGKMVVLWDVNSPCDSKKMIWCAEIVLERGKNCSNIWGIVKWFGHVLTVPNPCHFIEVLVPTL